MNIILRAPFCLCLILSAHFRTQAQKLEMVVPAGHSITVLCTAISPDGKILASGSRDTTIKLWDIQSGKLIRTLLGHSAKVTSLTFSPDGAKLISQSIDLHPSQAEGPGEGTVKIWDIQTGTPIVDSRGEGARVETLAAALSPDKKILAYADSSGTIRLRDIESGKLVRTLAGHPGFIISLVFSPDGKQMVSAASKGSEINPIDAPALVWNIENGTLTTELENFSNFYRKARYFTRNLSINVHFNSNGSILADAEAKLFATTTGKLVRSLKGEFAAFSPDGRIAGTWNGSAVNLWDAGSGELISSSEVTDERDFFRRLIFSPDGQTVAASGTMHEAQFLLVCEARSGKLIAKLEDRGLVGYSSDGKTLAVVHLELEEALVELYDPQNGQLLKTLGDFPDWREQTEDVFDSVGGLWAVPVDASVELWDTPSGQLFRRFAGDMNWVTALSFSHDGRLLAAAKGEKFELWDTQNGNLTYSLNGKSSSWFDHSHIAFNPEGTLVTVANGQLWSTQNGSEVYPLDGDADFSPSQNVFALTTEDGVELRDAKNGSFVRKLLGGTRPFALAFSPDGKMLAAGVCLGVSDCTLKLIDVASGGVHSLDGEIDLVEKLAFSPDGKMLAVVHGGGNQFCMIALVDVRAGRVITDFEEKPTDPEDTIEPYSQPGVIAFSPDSKLLVLGSIEKRGAGFFLEMREVPSGKLRRTLAPPAINIMSAAFSGNGKVLATGSTDSSITLWSVESGEMLATLLSFNDANWLVVAPNGRFDGSPAAWNQVLWRSSNNTFEVSSVEVFFNEFYSPGLLGDIISGKGFQAPRKIEELDRRQPQLTIALDDGQAPAGVRREREVAVKIEVAEAPKDKKYEVGSGAQDVRLFRNGSLVRHWKGDLFALSGKDGCKQGPGTGPQKSRSSVCTVRVPIVAGANNFTAYAFNRDNVKSEDAATMVTGDDSLKRAGTLYVLAVGVNKYENNAFDLTYAIPDAEEFGAELKRQQDNLRNYERTEITQLYNQQATKARILTALGDLAGKVKPEDALVVYFSGHGTVGSCLSTETHQVNAADRFYLVPHDLGYKGEVPRRCEQRVLDEVVRHSISDLDLEAAFEMIDAGHQLLVIDACNSGQALESEEKRRGPMNSRGLAQLAYEKGMYVLAAAQSLQEAKADKKIAKGHGYLTYALVEEALKTKVAANSDGNVLLRQWVDYAVRRVPRMQRAEAAERREFVKKEKNQVVPNEPEVQHPRVFYRRDADLNPLVVAKP